MALVAGAAGFAVASLGRHTAAALGAVLAAFVIGVIGVSTVAFAAGARFPQAWLWTSYVDAWMRKSVTFYDYRSCQRFGQFGECLPATREVTWQVAGLGMAAVLALLVGAAMWHMRSRDVT
jgi:ABC-2 type transport system permease protein